MHSNRENRSWLRCSSKWLAVIFLQTTEMVSALGIWKQSMQKELTAPGFITGMGWKMRRLCMLEPNWQGETRNHIGLGSWDCEQGKMLYPDARFWFKVTEHLGGRRFSCFTAFAHSLFLPPTISFLFFPWNLLINRFFFSLRAWCKAQQNRWKVFCWLSYL